MKRFFLISIGQKYLVGLTGLGLAVFVLMHMLGNLLIFGGPEAYNSYAHLLESNIFLLAFELILLTTFSVHIGFAIWFTIKNYQARGQKYIHLAQGEKATRWWQKSLPAQGIVILVFVILHLITFKFGEEYTVTYKDGAIRDLYRLVVETFKDPVTVIWYLGALLVLSVHLFHGLVSSFQSLGLSHPRYEVYLKKISLIYVVFVSLGYISLPLYVFFLT